MSQPEVSRLTLLTSLFVCMMLTVHTVRTVLVLGSFGRYMLLELWRSKDIDKVQFVVVIIVLVLVEFLI